MKNKKKSRIDTYKSVYPVELVVANEYASIAELRKKYTCNDGTEIPDDDMQCNRGIVYRAMRKSDGIAILLVRIGEVDKLIKDKTERLIDIISVIGHEAGHVVLETYDRISERECVASQEPFCYYLQWVIKCICTTVFKD